MKKMLVLLLVLGLASTASAALSGSIGYKAVPSPGYENIGTEANPLSDSDTMYIDIVMYAAGPDVYVAVNATGEIYLDVLGPAEIGLTAGRYGALKAEPGLPTMDSIGVTYFNGITTSGFQYIPAGTPPPVPPPPEYNGYNIMELPTPHVFNGPHDMFIAGGLEAGAMEWLLATGTSEYVVFDHIPIHCTGIGPVDIVVSGATASAPFGLPVIATESSSYVLDTEENVQGGVMTIYQIPEPMTLTLLGLGGLALVRRRRKV